MKKKILLSVLLVSTSYSFAQTSLQQAIDSFQTFTGYQFPQKEHLESIIRNGTIIINDAITNKMPVNPEIYKGRGNAFYNLEIFDKAIEDYSKMIALDSTNFWNLFIRADAYEKFNQWELAAADYVKVIQLNDKEKKPDDFYAEKAYSALRKASRKTFFKLIKSSDTRPLYLKYYDSALLHFDDPISKDPREALLLLQKAEAAYHTNGMFYSRIYLLTARLYKKFGNHGNTIDGALYYYNKFLKHTNIYIDGFDLIELGNAYIKAGLKKEALETFEQAYNEAETEKAKQEIKEVWDRVIEYYK